MSAIFFDKVLAEVKRFNEEILQLGFPDHPTMLTGERFGKRLRHLNEEMIEFQSAASLDEQVDALVDLIYVAAGAILEMGYLPGPAFDEVHAANMRKVPGANKRGSVNESAKPPGWTPPDFMKWRDISRADLDHIHEQRERPEMYFPNHAVMDKAPRLFDDRTYSQQPESLVEGTLTTRLNPWDGASVPAKPKILILGHGRHGKDTVAEMLRDEYGLSFTSSSLFCAERVMLPYFARRRLEAIEAGVNLATHPCPHYETVEQCFEDRHNHRAIWFQQIEAYNSPDKARLGHDILELHDVYAGVRSRRELNAIKNAGLADFVVWVDASFRLPPEDASSITIEPWMADFMIDNNGTLDELRFAVRQMAEGVLGLCDRT